jgi:hypothetical protein
MPVDISEYLPDRQPAPDDTSTESGGEQHSEKRVEIDEELGQLLPGEARAERPRQTGESARTTFRLTPDAIQLFGRLSGRTGKSQKDLLGDALRLSRKALENDPEQVRAAAARFEDGTGDEEGTSKEETGAAKKTMAIAPETRAGLSELAEEAGLPRDHLVEVGIRLAKVTLEEALRKKFSPHEDMLGDVRALCTEVEEVQTAITGARMENGSEEYEDPVEQALFDILGALSVGSRGHRGRGRVRDADRGGP